MTYRLYTKGEIIADHYLVLEHRRGGLSDVYLTFDLHPIEHNCLALKTLRLEEGWEENKKARAMLQQEAASWVSLGAHPNIVRCYKVDSDIHESSSLSLKQADETLYLVLEWVADEESNTRSLRDVLVEHKRIGHTSAFRLAGDLCLALLHCQSRLPGFVHGDIKPENVLIGEQATFKLTDFGLARTAFSIRSHNQTSEEQAAGTPFYMAPELWLRQMPDERTDIYAIGCLLYEVFEGERPFAGRTISLIRRAHLEMDPASPALMSKPVWELVRSCLAKDPAERPANYRELAERIGDLSGQGRVAKPPSPGNTELIATDYGNQALTLMHTGYYEEAFKAFEKALAMDPNLSRAYNNRAILYRDLKRYDEALADWTRAIEIDPEFVEAYNNRAALYHNLGRLELSIQDARRVVELNDNWPTGLITLAQLLLEIEQREEALQLVNRALKLDPVDILGLVVRGEIQMALGQFSEALASFEQVQSVGSRRPELVFRAQIKRIQCLARMNEADKAFAELDLIIIAWPEMSSFLGNYFLGIDQPKLALRALAGADLEDEHIQQAFEKVLTKLLTADDP